MTVHLILPATRKPAPTEPHRLAPAPDIEALRHILRSIDQRLGHPFGIRRGGLPFTAHGYHDVISSRTLPLQRRWAATLRVADLRRDQRGSARREVSW